LNNVGLTRVQSSRRNNDSHVILSMPCLSVSLQMKT